MKREEAIQILYTVLYEKIEEYDRETVKYAAMKDLYNQGRYSNNMDLIYQVKRYLEDNLK